MQLRFATWGAAEGWTRVLTAASPFLVSSEDAVLHDMQHDPSTRARFVVVEDGEVLGLARVRERPGGVRSVMIQVDPAHQGRGVGRLLLERVQRVVASAEVTGIANGDARSLDVVTHWGFQPVREHRISGVDPRTVPDPPSAPAGLRVVPLEDAGAEAVWVCHQEAAADDPSGLTRPMPFETHLATQWRTPVHRADLGRAVVDGDRVVAYSQVDVADDRAWNAMTGCLPDHRGRGLARLAKQHALGALAAAGVTLCSTGNDEANRPMLAVNDRLGYRPTGSTWTVRRPAEQARP
jgi:GNAT superfamily N-acetyltransferase